MNRRIASIDILRGIAIIGMILSANIGFNSDLPAWMFHAQTPPPTYAFNPEIPGITWVDLVFPFFLFAMGAAFPFALKKRFDEGEGWKFIATRLEQRWITLTLFALLLGNAYSIWQTTQSAVEIYVFYIAIWAGLFLTLVRVRPQKEGSFLRRHLGKIVNLSGLSILIACAFIYEGWFGLELNKWASDIIIMILAVTAIFGGLIWAATRNSLRLRWLTVLFVVMIKALSSYLPQSLDFIPDCTRIGWFFNYRFLQYLIIALIGSIAGDMILRSANETNDAAADGGDLYSGLMALAAVLLQLWGLYSRHLAEDLSLSAILAMAFVALTWKNKGISSAMGKVGLTLLLVGILFDPIDGGITKDHCNLSYLLTTSGMAALCTSFLLTLEMRFNVKGKFIAGVGQNPMIAYTITTFLIGPVLNLTGILPALGGLTTGSPFWGITQGIFITLLMMGGTYIFTRLKLFWRS